MAKGALLVLAARSDRSPVLDLVRELRALEYRVECLSVETSSWEGRGEREQTSVDGAFPEEALVVVIDAAAQKEPHFVEAANAAVAETTRKVFVWNPGNLSLTGFEIPGERKALVLPLRLPTAMRVLESRLSLDGEQREADGLRGIARVRAVTVLLGLGVIPVMFVSSYLDSWAPVAVWLPCFAWVNWRSSHVRCPRCGAALNARNWPLVRSLCPECGLEMR